MNTLEDELRQLLADPSRTVAGWPDAPERIHAGIRRRRHRRAVALGTAAAVVLIAIAAAASTTWLRGQGTVEPIGPSPSVAPSSNSDIVAWLDLPPAQPTPPAARTPAATCRTSDLALGEIMTNGAGGTLPHFVPVRNTGSTRCTLSGRPALLKQDANGNQVPAETAAAHAPYSATQERPATIDPGESAQIIIETYGSCLVGQKAITYSDVALRMPDGGILPLHTSLDATCGVGVSEWYRLLPDPGSQGPSLDGVTVSIEAPSSVATGSSLDFVVTLTNNTDVDL